MMTGEKYLDEEEQRQDDGNAVGGCRSTDTSGYGRHNQRGEKLPKIERGRNKGHDRHGRLPAAFDACNSIDVRHSYAIGDTYEYRTHNHACQSRDGGQTSIAHQET